MDKLRILKLKLPFLIVIFLGLLLLTYSVSRAIILSMTHDESFTYLWFVPETFMQIVSMHIPKAGNHIINTLLIKLFTTIFPDTEFIIRLPNLLAQFFYILFSILIVKRFRNSVLIIGGFILLNFNPYMIEFFALARGYGLSLAFLMASIYYFLRYVNTKALIDIYLSFALAALSAISSFIYLHFFISLIITYNLIHCKDFQLLKNPTMGLKLILEKNLPTLITSIVLVLILFEPIRKLSKFNELYGHGKAGFYKNTVITFIHGSKYDQDYGSITPERISYFLLGLLSLICIAVIVDLVRKEFDFRKSVPSITACLLLIPAVTIIGQHHILGSEYPTFRLTLIFVPLLGFTLIYAYKLFQKPIFQKLSLFAIAFLSGALLFHTITSINLEKTYEWKYDADTKQMIHVLEELSKTNHEDSVKTGINWVFEPTINFYRITNDYKWLQPVTRDGYNGEYDYYYVFKENQPEIKNAEICKEFSISNTVLLKRTNE